MAKLVLSLNGAVQGEFELARERLSIGRKADNDIQIDNLAVSGKHALKDGDVVGLGKHELKYVNEHATADDDDFEKTMIIRPGSASAAVAAAQAAEEAGAAAEKAAPAARPGAAPAATPGTPPSGMPLGKLHVLNGPIAGKQLELTKALITLGKPGVQVAVISRRPQGYFLTHIEGDSKGDNFPIVNGSPIGPQAYTMQTGDVIELAGIKMEFTLAK